MEEDIESILGVDWDIPKKPYPPKVITLQPDAMKGQHKRPKNYKLRETDKVKKGDQLKLIDLTHSLNVHALPWPTYKVASIELM